MSEHQEITPAPQQQPERVSKRPVVAPAVDIYENDDEVLVVADVPGVATGGVHVQFDRNQLLIEAQRTMAEEGRSARFREFGAQDFRRVFDLAPGIDVSRISADLKLGVLTVHLPKSASLKPRQIPVRAE